MAGKYPPRTPVVFMPSHNVCILQALALEELREAVTDSCNLRLPISYSAPAFPNVRSKIALTQPFALFPLARVDAISHTRKGLNFASHPRHPHLRLTGGLQPHPAGARCRDAPLWPAVAFNTGKAPAGDRDGGQTGLVGAIGER